MAAMVQFRTIARRVFHPLTVCLPERLHKPRVSVALPHLPLAFRMHIHLPEVFTTMMLSGHYAIASTYRVEVSGWDKNQAFFVEKSELEWSEECGKQLLLTRAIPDGALIFLRMIASMSVDRSDPVAYETEFVETTPDGLHQFRLHPVSPRMAEPERVN